MTRKNPKLQTDKISISESTLQQHQKDKQRLSTASIGLWFFWGIYIYILLLSPSHQIIGGEPVWLIQPHTIQEALNESINFFFILPIANALNLNLMTSPQVHPVSQALFNFAEAWILMFLPLMLADPQAGKLPRISLWGLAMFLTNVFLIPYMALRTPILFSEKLSLDNNNLLKKLFGWIAISVGIISILWGCIAFPESGNLAQRGQYFVELLTSDRLTIAFTVDLVLFWIFQVILLDAIMSAESKKQWFRFVPFFGLASWLIL